MLISGLKVKIYLMNGMSFVLRSNLSSCFSYLKIKKKISRLNRIRTFHLYDTSALLNY